MTEYLSDALALRAVLDEYTACLCALHEAGTCRELYFETLDAAKDFARRRRVVFEWPERPRGWRAVDFAVQGNFLDFGHGVAT